MQKFISRLLACAALLGAAPSLQAQDETPEPIQFGAFQLRALFAPERVEVADADGQQELVLTRTSVILEGVEFAEGVIEFDMAFEDKFGFGGLFWHSSEDGTDSEYFYIRQHKSGLPDAGQYTPVRDGLTSWQIYTDRNAIAPFAHTHEGWNRIKFVIADDKADIYYNGGARPSLHVPDLAADRGNGAVGLRTTGADGKIRFANLVVRPLAEGEGIVGTPAADGRVAPEGTITRWAVSTHFPEANVDGALQLPQEVAALPTKAVLDTESFGIVDLSRGGLQEQEEDTALVSTRIVAERAKRVRLAIWLFGSRSNVPQWRPDFRRQCGMAHPRSVLSRYDRISGCSDARPSRGREHANRCRFRNIRWMGIRRSHCGSRRPRDLRPIDKGPPWGTGGPFGERTDGEVSPGRSRASRPADNRVPGRSPRGLRSGSPWPSRS